MHALRIPLVFGLGCAVLSAQDSFRSDQPPKQLVPLPEDRAKGAEHISVEQLKKFLGTLAGEEFAGRGTGQEGFRKAANYVRTHFESLGLKPAFGDSYFQRVPWKRIAPDPESYRFATGKDGKTVLPLELLGGNFLSSVVHKGRAMVMPIADLDNPGIEDLKLNGALVFLLVTDETKSRVSERRLIRLRRAAREAGAVEMVLVDDRYHKVQPILTGPAFQQRAGRIARGRRLRGTNLIAMSKAGFAGLMKQLGEPGIQNLARLKSPHSLAEAVDVNMATVEADAPAFNVAAVLPGSDPKLKDEYVVIGSHLDHLGRRRGQIYYGADDDGSGSATVMALAQAFAKNARITVPRRSVMFVAFCGEENGLVGSKYFSDNSPIKLEKIVTQLQIDMVGRDEQKGEERAEENTNCLHLVGTEKLSAELHELCLQLNRSRAQFGLEWDEEGVYYRSDHFSFARYGVPIAFFFTGFHPDYHRPSDTVEKINFVKMARIGRYIYDIAFELAQQDQRPRVDPERWEKMARKGRAQPVAPLKQQ